MAAFGTLHALVGVGLTYFMICGLVERTIITIAPGMVKIRHLPLPVPGSIDMPSSEITQLYTKETVSHSENGTDCLYAVHIKTYNQKDKNLISGLTERDHALYIEQQIERYLGIMDTHIDGEIHR
jgi:hypothetical protein